MIRPASGFTLVEMLVAISVMALVIAGLASMGITTIKADTHSRRQSAAMSLAQAKLEDLRVLRRSAPAWTNGDHSETVDENGTIGNGSYKRVWTVDRDYNTFTNLSRVTVRVSWDDSTSGSVSLASLFW